MAMVVPLTSDNEKASRALMATEVAPMDAQATSASSDSPQKLLENAVETIGDAVGSPSSSRGAKEGDNALNTLVEVAAAVASERPEGTAELLKQEPSSLATKEEDMEVMEEREEGASTSSQELEQDSSSNAQLTATPEKPKPPASKDSPASSVKDAPSTVTDEEEMDTSDLPNQTTQEVYTSPLSSPQKGSSRNQKYSMRTRRASCMDPTNTSDSDAASSKRKPRDVTPSSKQPSLSPPSSPAHSDSEPEERKTDLPKRGKGRGKTRGRGVGRGILKKTQNLSEPSTRAKQAEVPATGRGRGRGRGRPSSTQAQSPMTRAAAAGLQAVQFLSLPRKRSKKRQGEEGTEDDYEDDEEEEDEEEDDSPVKPHSKKPKLEEQSEDAAQETTPKTGKTADTQSSKGKVSKQKSKEQDTVSMDSTLEDDKETSEVDQDDKTVKSPSKPVSRRGGRRGRRGGGGRGAMAGASRGSRLDTTTPEKGAEKDDVVEITEAKKNSPMQPPTRGKRRGRPPKKKPEPDVIKSKTKEESEDSAPVTDKTSRDSQEDENCEEMEEDQAKESTESTEQSTATAASGDKKEQENTSQDESTDNDAVSVKVEKEAEKTSGAPAAAATSTKTATTGDNPVKTSSVIVSVLSGSKPTTETPSTSKQSHVPAHPSAPGEGHFPYHPFPMDDMHAMPPHPFIHSGYPPFSAPPYGSFLVPSSPSYPYPPPPEHYHHMYAGYQEDMSYHGFPRPHLPSLPPQAASTSSTSSSSTTSATTTTSNTTSTPAQETESSNSGGEQQQKTSPSTPSVPPPGPSPTTPHAMEMPMCYAPHPTAGYLPSYVIPMEWSVPPHSAQRPPMMPSPTTIKPATGTNEPRFPLNLFHDDQRSNQPVDCPECGRHFKNNKALNGHMRLHGGFDWTRKPYQAIQQMQQQQKDQQQQQQQAKEQQPKASSPTPPSDNFVREQLKQHVRDKHSNDDGKQADEPPKKKDKERKVTSSSSKNSSRKYSKEKNSASQREEERSVPSRIGPTLDDLCRAAAELERIDSRNGMKELESAVSKKHRPGNISIPSHSSPLLHHHDRQKLTSFSPPYTPPPILSPSRSMTMLANITSGGPATPQVALPCTPNKIWQRKGSERVSESEDSFSYAEPKINVGKEFQAELPECNPDESPADTVHKATRVWEPLLDLTQEEEDTVDGFLELACSPVMPHAGRNKEFALHTLYQTKGSIKEAVRLLVTGRSAISRDDPMATYNYTGSKRWTGRERQQFRHAFRVHHKVFPLIRSALENKKLPEIVEYYYTWKKYCNDEYRGRNRHISEEILSEEDETGVRPPSAASSSGSSASGELESHSSSNPSSSARYSSSRSLLQNSPGSLPHEVMEHLPRAYVPHVLNNPPIQEHHCKYPGCNQVYTSIFALNGHIRVHGGSWYPKKTDVENGPETSGPPPPPPIMGYSSSTSLFGSGVAPHRSRLEDRHTSHQLEVAKTMVMDLPQPRSPAHSLATHTPSPKPSPGRVKSSLVRSRKANSSSPADRDGFYPCNRCGRVFTKVKSRSAHMKSHIVKQS